MVKPVVVFRVMWYLTIQGIQEFNGLFEIH